MKKYSSVIFTSIIFGSIVFYCFILPRIRSKSYSLAGEVVFINQKPRRNGQTEIEVKEKKELRYIYYTFLDDVYDINIGDSLFKAGDNTTLYIKSKKDSLIKEARDQEYLLGP